MAQNITLLGASYSNVPAVTLPKTGGGTASFTDVTDTTATASDVASGKYFYDASGTRTQGTSSGGGGISVDDIARNLAPSGAIMLGSNVTEVSKYAFARKPITSVVGESVTSILENAFYYCTSLTSISFPNLVSTSGGSNFRGCALTSVNFPELTAFGSSYVFENNANIETGVFPKLTSQNQSFRASKFLTLDFGKKISIGNYWFTDCNRLTTLILRSTELCPCTNTGGFSGTPFKNGGTGGTIYIPKSLYDHLGDNSAYDYQHASNWSTIYGYGTITWAKIEGSYYETHYADGTLIGA